MRSSGIIRGRGGRVAASSAALALVAVAVPAGTLAVTAPDAAARAAVTVVHAPAADTVRPGPRPVRLTSTPRELAVTYTYQNRERSLDDFIARTKTNGFVVLDGQKIVYERYVGAGPSTRFQSWSVAKSFTSAALGIAVHEGRVRSIDDPVTRYMPELRGSGYEGVPIRDLLRMSSGIEWNEPRDVPKLQRAANQGRSIAKLAAEQVRGTEPGSTFTYTSINSYVLAEIISRATGMPYHQYVEKKIWQPAGMAGTALIGNDGTDNLGYCCYYATDRDFARFGLLYLNGGRAKGRQVVPASWVKESTRPSPANPHYGLHWWLGGGNEGDYMAAGLGGQHIYVSPKRGVVIVNSVTAIANADDQEALAAFRAVAAAVAKTR